MTTAGRKAEWEELHTILKAHSPVQAGEIIFFQKPHLVRYVPLMWYLNKLGINISGEAEVVPPRLYRAVIQRVEQMLRSTKDIRRLVYRDNEDLYHDYRRASSALSVWVQIADFVPRKARRLNQYIREQILVNTHSFRSWLFVIQEAKVRRDKKLLAMADTQVIPHLTSLRACMRFFEYARYTHKCKKATAIASKKIFEYARSPRDYAKIFQMVSGKTNPDICWWPGMVQSAKTFQDLITMHDTIHRFMEEEQPGLRTQVLNMAEKMLTEKERTMRSYRDYQGYQTMKEWLEQRKKFS